MDPNVRKPVFFDTFNDDSPNDLDVAREISKMNIGESFDESILPRVGWFVGLRPPRRIPSIFIANGFFVVDEAVQEILAAVAGDSVTLHPFELYAKEGGDKIGTFFVVVFRNVRSDISSVHASDSMRFAWGSKYRKIRADAKNDSIVVVVPSVKDEPIWIERWIRNSVFLNDEAFNALRAELKRSMFETVRCLVYG
jgi:hypothetical protein